MVCEPIDFRTALARLERALIIESHGGWRELLLQGEEVALAQPEGLPPLTDDLHVWFGWRSSAPRTPDSENWRCVEWAVEQRRRLDSEGVPKSLVPVQGNELRGVLVDANDGHLWEHVDLVDDYKLSPLPMSFAQLLANREHAIADRRRSPWRRCRIDRADERPWLIAELPTHTELAEAPLGMVFHAVFPANRRRNRAEVVWKVGPDQWASTSAVCIVFDDEFDQSHVIDFLFDSIRYGLDGGELTDTRSDEELAQWFARISARSREIGGMLTLHHGAARIWEQPTIAELLTRLDRALSTHAPSVHRSLRAPASSDDILALEHAIARPLPDDLRALFAFADGQGDGADGSLPFPLYRGHTLVSVSQARHTLDMMRALARDEFGDAYWDAAFVPFLDRGNGDHLCVDVAGAYGPEGCVVDFNHEAPDSRTILFESVTQWLECLVDGLEAGVYVEEEVEGIHPRGFLQTFDLREVERFEKIRTHGAYPWSRPVRW